MTEAAADFPSDAGTAGQLADRWLQYCRRVVSDQLHHRLCAALGGSADVRAGVYPDVRWPGYLGATYRPGGVLWVNIVHRDMANQWTVTDADALAEITRRWTAGSVSDAQYLAAVRRGYLSALSAGWNVGRNVRALAEAVGIGLDAIAYTNAARCQVVPADNYAARQQALTMFCQGWLPLHQVVAAIQPGLVYVSALDVMPMLHDLPGDPLVVGISQRGRRSPHGAQIPGGDRWNAIALAYRARMP